jgi:hypothetical protein
MSTHPYKHTHAYYIYINTFERLSRFYLEIHKVGHKEYLAINGGVVSH